ncbi:MAG: molybdopterin oxidoreductase [Alphaproteobacteria bacterium]|nr:MAG: molybdopterin oxidoreductase [Alphaproteobacteria bacterium]
MSIKNSNIKTDDIKTIIGACPHDCPDTCSMLISVQSDKVLGVRGNPDHPFTRGRLCAKVINYQDRVNSSQRILHPMRRIGSKGSGQFRRISWDEALKEIGDCWNKIIDDDGPQAILPYSYLGTQGIINGLNVGDPFFNRLGATIGERTFCDSGASTAIIMTIGDSAAVDPESLVHSKYIILWACNILSTNSHLWPFIAEARKRGAKLVVIDPFRTRTARKADWHIPILPGTDGALALGIMHILIKENLVDQDYIDKYTLGYDELKIRVEDYDPETVSVATGIAAEDICTLAREYAGNNPAVIRIGVAIERHAGGGQTVRALACLPALTGAWRKPGGGILQMTTWAHPVNWGQLMRPDMLPESPRVLNLWRLGQALVDELSLDPPIKSLMIYNANPVVTGADQNKIIAGLQREDLFTVVSEQFMTDTARYADILLPATTQLEQEDIMFSWGHLYMTYNNRAVSPLGEAISNSELFRRLAYVMGFDDDPYFKRSDDQMIEEAIIWESPMLKDVDLETLKEKGYVRLNIPGPDHYAPHAEGNFRTASGKCEFKSSVAVSGNFVLPLLRQGYDGDQPKDTVDPLPHYIPPRETPQTNKILAKKYPLNLISPKSHTFLNSSYGNMKRQLRSAGRQFILIHPEDAKSRKIETDQKVKIFNDRGSFIASVTVTEDVMPGVLIAPSGYWLEQNQGKGTVQSVTSSQFSDLGRAPTFSDILVEIKSTYSGNEKSK